MFELCSLISEKIFAKSSKAIFLLVFSMTAFTTTAIVVTNPLTNTSAQAAGLADWLPVPSGLYLKIDGREFFYGDYVETGVPVFAGSVWEYKSGGRVILHGYGNTPGWLVNLFARLGPSIHAE